MNYPPACPHDAIAAIATDTFMVRGSVYLNPVLRITRNMVIVRHGTELTLINPLRMSAGGLDELGRLGTVRHILRLGPYHGQDDPFYLARSQPQFWCQPGHTHYPVPAASQALREGGELPFPGARVFCFQGTLQPEAALLLESGGGLLLTCDAIQHYGDHSQCNLLARLLLPLVGFPKTTLVGPIWLKALTPPGGSLRAEFERLQSLRFDSLLAAHGTLLRSGAQAAVARAFPHG